MTKYSRLRKRIAALDEKCALDRRRAREAGVATRNSLREKITGFPALGSMFLFGFTLGYVPGASRKSAAQSNASQKGISGNVKNNEKTESASTLSRIKAPLIVLVVRHYLSKL